MLDGKGSGTKKIGQGCKNDKTTTKSATTTTVTITIRAKQQIAGNNSNGTRESGFERINGPTNRRKNARTQNRTRAGIPGGHKVNNGRHRSNLSQMKTVLKARDRVIAKENNPRTTIQKGKKSTSPTSP